MFVSFLLALLNNYLMNNFISILNAKKSVFLDEAGTEVFAKQRIYSQK